MTERGILQNRRDIIEVKANELGFDVVTRESPIAEKNMNSIGGSRDPRIDRLVLSID